MTPVDQMALEKATALDLLIIKQLKDLLCSMVSNFLSLILWVAQLMQRSTGNLIAPVVVAIMLS